LKVLRTGCNLGVPRPRHDDHAASDQNATVAAGFLGWMLDAFDFSWS